MASPVLSVWRCIVRHARHIPDLAVAADLRRVKRVVRNHRSHARRGHVQALFEVEEELRKVCLGHQSLAKARGRFQSAADKHAHRKAKPSPFEQRNQEAQVNLWKQHESRRFDEYNRPPRKGSSQWLAVDRRARVSNATAAFLRRQPPAMERSAVVDTVLAPFWHATRSRSSPTHGAADPARPRPRRVELTTLSRVGGTLSLLRVRGVRGRGRGLRRHVEAVSRDTLEPLRALNFDLWLAKQYARDPLGDADMGDWIRHLTARKRELELRHQCQESKNEVQRRILSRRRAELERAWEWRYRRHVQAQDRQARLEAGKHQMLRLDTL